MALVCPITLPQASEGGCAGSFFSAEQQHLISPDGYDLVFEQLIPRSNQKIDRLFMALNGRIVGLHRVPLPPKSSQKLVNTNGPLDMLLIHTQTSEAESEDENVRTVKDQLHFKLFDPESQEFNTVSVFNFDGGPYHPLSSAWYSVAVCLELGSMFGTVAFSNSGSGTVHFLDPFDVKSMFAYNSSDSRSALQTSSVTYWVSENIAAVVRKKSDQMAYLLDFLKVERRSKNAKSSFKVSSIDCVTLPPGLKPSAITPIPSNSNNTLVSVVLSDETVSTFAVKSGSVELVDEKRLDLPIKDQTTAERFGLVKAKSRCWFQLKSERKTESYLVSDDGMVLMVYGAGDFKLFRVEGLPQGAVLSPLGIGIFKLRESASFQAQLISIRTGKNANEPSIEHNTLKAKSYEFNNAQLLKHDYNPFFGSSIWLSFKGPMSNYLCKMERTICPLFSALEDYPFALPVVGVWVLDKHVLVSTGVQTAMFKLQGSRLSHVSSEFEGNICTIAAAPGVQVTRDTIRLAGGHEIRLPLSSAVSAAIDESTIVVASVDAVLLFEKENVIQKLCFDEVIIDVDCQHSVLAICTANALHVHHLDSGKKYMCQLRELSTSVACGSDGQIYVGDVAGDVFIWPEQQYVKIAQNPIKSIRRQSDSMTILAGPEGSAYVDSNRRFQRLQVGDASDVVFGMHDASMGLAVIDGVLKLVDADIQATMASQLIDASNLLHSRPEDVKLWGDTLYSFGVSNPQRSLQKASLSNLLSIQSLDIPAFSQAGITDFQVFMLSETKFIEVARKEPNESESSSSDDDDDDDSFDDFDTHIFVRLYEIRTDLGKICLLTEKDFHISGDPFEEIVVKFFGTHDFVLFTHSSSAIAVNVDPQESGSLTLGESASCYEYLYDDHWIPSDDGGVIVISFIGDVSRVSSQHLRETEPLVDCFRNPSAKLGTVSSYTGISEAVFDAFKVGETSAHTARLATASRAKTGEHIGKVSLIDVSQTEVAKVADLRLYDRGLSLAGVNKKVLASQLNAGGQVESKYHEALLPVVVVGTSRGAAYSWSTVNDKTLFDALLNVQRALLQSIEILDSEIVKDETTIDGALLMAALKIPEAEPVFASASLDTTELRKALEFLMY